MSEWKPNFFKAINHPYITKNMFDLGDDQVMLYKLIENEGDDKGYWERRKN